MKTVRPNHRWQSARIEVRGETTIPYYVSFWFCLLKLICILSSFDRFEIDRLVLVIMHIHFRAHVSSWDALNFDIFVFKTDQQRWIGKRRKVILGKIHGQSRSQVLENSWFERFKIKWYKRKRYLSSSNEMFARWSENRPTIPDGYR